MKSQLCGANFLGTLLQDENNTLRLQVEELGNKLRRSDMMFARVKDELERYRIGAGKTPFPNIDEEQRLKTKLQVISSYFEMHLFYLQENICLYN